MKFNRLFVSLILTAAAAASQITPVVASPVGGSRSAVTSVNAYGTDRFNPIRFYGDERAVVTISGDGTSDLDLYVYDENGYLVASDDDGSDQCAVSFTPAYTGYFTVVVVNRGGVWNEYSLHAF
jgi:hypothetical protein